jgi:hypothetical protein
MCTTLTLPPPLNLDYPCQQLSACAPLSLLCSEHKKFSYGYSNVRGKRACMEDFHDTKISEVNGEMIGLFGVFDGQRFLGIYAQ